MPIHNLIQRLVGDQHETYPPATDADILTTEEALGWALPASYQTFVKSFSNGAYLYSCQEVSAVGQGNEQVASLQDVRDLVPDEGPIPYRDHEDLVAPATLFPFSLDGNGNAWCFVGQEGVSEPPVAYLDTSGCKLYAKLENFTAWLETLVNAEEKEEVIRLLCDEDVIEDELELG